MVKVTKTILQCVWLAWGLIIGGPLQAIVIF